MGLSSYFLILLWVFLELSTTRDAHATSVFQQTIVDVTKFGAVGDGKTDDFRAFQSAWEAACKKETNNGKVIVPSGKTFLVSPIEFEGPCTSTSITFEILGDIVAPPKSTWLKRSANAWLSFHQVDRLIVAGNGQGVIDGRGESWWKLHGQRPTALRFSQCNGLQVSGLKHRNSQQNHISVDGCNAATISNLDIRAPAESPNTDGIDISGSTHIRIHDCLVATGDDCIAIKAGTSNVNISNIACGPGHGISIGSLGEDGNDDQVEGISITNSNFTRTENGVRIKTWQGGSGFAKNITFSGITFIAVDNPIIIDQHYCPHKKCADKSTSAVKISDVKYSGLHGSSISKTATINFSCSTTVPCTNIVMDDVDIESADQSHHSATAYCTNAQGKAHAVHPSVNCLINY